jgi:O-antigen ligase
VAPYAANSKPIARAGLVMIGLAWTLPFLQPFHHFPLTGFYSEWLAFGLGLAGAAALLHRPTWPEPEMPAVALAPIGLAIVVGVQAALGRAVYDELALTAALYLSWAALLVVLGRMLRNALGLERLVVALAWWSLAGGLLSALAGLLQHFQPFTAPVWLVSLKSRPEVYGNLGQANHFATYLAIALAALLYLYGRGLRTGAFVACAALLLPPLALSGSRSAWLYLIILALLATVARGSGAGHDARRLRIAAWCLLPAFLAGHWLVSLPLAASSPSVVPTATSGERLFQVATGFELRLQLWETAWRMFLDAPVLGAGLGRFAWSHFVRAAGDPSMDPGLYMHAHNLVLHLMAETGAVGALVVLGPLLAWLAALRPAMLDLQWCWLLGVLAILAVHSLLEFPLWYAYFLGIPALLLGAGSGQPLRLRAAGAARAIVGIGIIAGSVNLIAVMGPYREFERLVFMPGRGAQPRDDAGFARAIARVHREPLLVPYVEHVLAIGVETSKDSLPEKLALVDRAAHYAPAPYVAYRYAPLLALAGEPEAARVQLERAIRVYPGDLPEARAQLSELARRYPEQMAPLLDAAAPRNAGIR